MSDKEIKELIKKIKKEGNQIEEAFEPIENLISRNLQLVEQLLGINEKGGSKK